MGTFQQPAAGARPPQGTDDAIDRDDPILEEWLSRPPTLRRASSSWPPRHAGDDERVPLGDHIADEWFR